jgi:hypothetical protein
VDRGLADGFTDRFFPSIGKAATWSNSIFRCVNNWPCPLYVRAGSDAKRRAPRTAADSVRTSSLTCGFTAMASPDHTRAGQRPASRAAAPRARHPWTPHAGSAPSNSRADNVRPGRRPKDHSGMSSDHNTGQARSTNRAPHAAAPRPRPQDQDLRALAASLRARSTSQPNTRTTDRPIALLFGRAYLDKHRRQPGQ